MSATTISKPRFSDDHLQKDDFVIVVVYFVDYNPRKMHSTEVKTFIKKLFLVL